MLRVLLQGMRELGLHDTPAPDFDEATAAVALDAKRALLTQAVARGGLGCLALLGRGLHRYAQEPTHRALSAARDVHDLLQRWGRLERYLHSRHRVQVLMLGACQARLQHISVVPGTQPLPPEDLVVLGLLAALLESIGLQGVRCEAGGVQVVPASLGPALDRALEQAAGQGLTRHWTLTWTAPSRLDANRPVQQPLPLDLVEGEPWPALAKASFHALAQRLLSPPDVAQLARGLAVSTRQLQRQLQQVGLSRTRLLAEARYRSAGWWLLHSSVPLAEVGFLCGYADQSHFTRDFRRRSALTPAAYRTGFAAPG